MLSNSDLEDLFKYYDVPLKGLYLSDMVPSGQPEDGCTIINLDRAYDADGPVGTHWTCLISEQTGGVYYDSFGAPPPKSVHAFLKRKYGKFGYNAWITQDLESQTCGFYCLAFCIFLTHHRDSLFEKPKACANRFVNLFGKKNNEPILRAFLLAQKHPHPLVLKKCK